MQEKVIEIIAYILGEMKHSKPPGDIDMKKLNKKGYSNTEINTAFAWVYSRIDKDLSIEKPEFAHSSAKRFLNSVEKRIITPEAQGYLILLKEIGILSDEEEESVLDKVLYAEFYRVGILEIKSIISSLFFDYESKSDVIERLVFQNNETIH